MKILKLVFVFLITLDFEEKKAFGKNSLTFMHKIERRKS